MLTPRRVTTTPSTTAIAELLLVVVPLAVAIVDAAHGGVPPIDDADARGRVDVRARADEDVAASCPLPASAWGLLLEAHVPEVGVARVEGPRDAPASLRPERPEVVHLLEQRREVVRLGDRDLVAELEEALVVERSAPSGGHVRASRRVRAPSAPSTAA